jgi:hypothetical protein
MNPDPEEAFAAIAAKIRHLLQAIEPRLEELRAEGMPVDEILVEAEEFLAAQQGQRSNPPDWRRLLARLTELVDEVNAAQHLQQQAEVVREVMDLPATLDDLSKQAEELRAHGGRLEELSAAELESAVASARKRLERGEMPAEEMEDIQLTLAAQKAELDRRIHKRTAAMMIYWEKQTPQWWAQRSPEELEKMRELQAQWAEEREKLLSELPLADRQELESMTLEDFDSPPRKEI